MVPSRPSWATQTAFPPEEPLVFNFLLSSSTIKTYEEFVAEPVRSNLLRLQYLQLKHFYLRNEAKLQIHRAPTTFEYFCLGKEKPTHLISTLYALFNYPSLNSKMSFQLSWKRELNCSISQEP